MVELHLDRWIGIACVTVPATAVGDEILALIERVHRAASPPAPSAPASRTSWLRWLGVVR